MKFVLMFTIALLIAVATTASTRAQTAFMAALSMAQEDPTADVVLDAKYGLARTYEDSGEFKEALVRYRELLELLRAASRKTAIVSEGEVLARTGNIYRLLSQYEPAIEHLLLAAVRFRDQHDLGGEAAAMASVADIFLWLQDFGAARSYYDQSLAIYKKQGNAIQQIRILASLAEATGRDPDPTAKSMDQYLQEAANLQESMEANFKNEFDIFWRKRADTMTFQLEEQDIQYARRDYESHKTTLLIPPSDPPKDYYDNVVALYHWQTRKSQEVFETWLSSFPTLGADYLFAIGRLYQAWGVLELAGGDAKEAGKTLGMSLVYLSSLPVDRDVAIELAKNFYYLGYASRLLKDFDYALFNFDSAYLLVEHLSTPEIHWIYAAIGQTYADKGEFDKALIVYRKGLEKLDTIQRQGGTEEIRIGIFESTASVYRQFVSLLLSLYEKTGEKRFQEEAFEYTQKGKARVFNEMQAKARTSRQNTTKRTDKSKDEEIDYEIAKIYRELRDVKLGGDKEKSLSDRLEIVRKRQAEYQKLALASDPVKRAALRNVTIGEVQAVLPTDAVLLEYLITSDSVVTLWAITKTEIRKYDLSIGDRGVALGEYLKTLRLPLFGATELNRHLELGERSYRFLIEPAEELLAGKKKLIVSPDNQLYYIPFETLIVPRKNSRNQITSAGDIHYLVKDIAITYIPSASAFVSQAESGRFRTDERKYSLLAFGDPLYSGELPKRDQSIQIANVSTSISGQPILKRLEFSGDEVRAVARIWGVAANSEHVNLREKATMTTLRSSNLSDYRILHFAVHAILQDEWGVLSQPSLVLSEDDKRSSGGRLQFSDILELKQNADLVILSACDTGLGKLNRAEGLIGLTRAFLYGGASSVVVSLWKVQDQSTGLFMQKFHERLKSGDNKDEALRQAKLDIMKTQMQLKATGNQESLASPFFWAPFILVGDGGPININ